MEDDAGGEPRDIRLRVDGDDRRRAPDARLHRHRSPGRGQPQLPPLGHQVGRLLRRPRAHRPRRARPRPAPTGRSRSIAPEGCLLNARAARRGGRRQRRDLEPGRRPGDRGARGRRAGARAGPGDDEQPDPGRRAASPTTRRSAAARAPARTPTGPSAIHVAMSNTLNTPVEALETEFPLRVRELSVRRGSGGDGRHRGGDGIVRELEALAPMRFTLITERRRHAPAGPRRRRRRRSRAATC